MPKDGTAEQTGEAGSAKQRKTGEVDMRTRRSAELHSGVVRVLRGVNVWPVSFGSDSSDFRAVPDLSSG